MAGTAGVLAMTSADDREQEIASFLGRAGWANALREAIQGDASFRRYERLRRQDESAILMDAPPERERTQPFIETQDYLLAGGLRAPRRIHDDAPRGLLLLEDFGDRSVSQALREQPGDERSIYRDAVALLVRMEEQGLSRLAAAAYRPPAYDAALLTSEVELLPQWFLPELLPASDVDFAAKAFRSVWAGLLAEADLSPEVVVHRDYHADNLFLLDGETGIGRIGLLDFQDAVMGRAAYDLVSLMTDARRDVSPAVAEAGIIQFLQSTGRDETAFRRDFSLYAAQRNAKILGIFTRLYRRDGKPSYLDMIPRVWAHFEASLAHPSLASLKDWRERFVTPQVESKLPVLRRLLTDTA